jgi:AcrR family transcriptional regulator
MSENSSRGEYNSTAIINSSIVEFMVAKRAGRRPGNSGTREAILEAARRQFAELGYDRTTLRSVAAEAGVDPALVVHFFGSKKQLFLAGVELPIDPLALAEELAAAPRSEVGARMATFLLTAMEDPDVRRRWIGMIRAATSEPEAATRLRAILETRLFTPLAEALGAEDAQFRATLAGSHIVGIGMARYIVGVEPIASAAPEKIAAAVAPTLQRYLVEPL